MGVYGMKKILIAVAVIAVGVTAYIQGKQYIARAEVKGYLASEGADVAEIDSFMANLSGDKNWMVVVELKGDDGHYYYYYDRENKKVVLESYIVDGVEYAGPTP